MRSLEGRLSRVEGVGRAPVSDLTAAQRADLAGPLRALLAAVPHDADSAAAGKSQDQFVDDTDQSYPTTFLLGCWPRICGLTPRLR